MARVWTLELRLNEALEDTVREVLGNPQDAGFDLESDRRELFYEFDTQKQARAAETRIKRAHLEIYHIVYCVQS